MIYARRLHVDSCTTLSKAKETHSISEAADASASLCLAEVQFMITRFQLSTIS